MRRRSRPVRIAIVATLCPALLAAGCSSSGGSAPHSSSANATTLADQMRSGLAGVKSAHLEVDLGSLGGKSSEDVSFAGGKVSATDVTMHTGSGDIEIVTVGGKSYAKLPATQNTSGKPWVLVTPDSKNPVVARLATGLTLATATTSLATITDFVASAKSVTDKGSAKVGGNKARHYVVDIDPAKSSGNAQLSQMLQLLGKSDIPIDLWVDDHHRPVKFTLDITAAAQHISVQAVISKYNEAVKIAAPPADQIGTA